MSNEFESAMLRRLDRLETLVGSMHMPPDNSSAIAQLAKSLQQVEARLAGVDNIVDRRIGALIDARLKLFGKEVEQLFPAAFEPVFDEVFSAEKRLKTQVEDIGISTRREAEKAAEAASMNIRASADFLMSAARKYGA